MAYRIINSTGALPLADVEYYDEDGVLQTVPYASFAAGYPSAASAVSGSSSGDILVANEAFDDSVLFEGFESENLSLYVAAGVKTDSSNTENGYRFTNMASGASKRHRKGCTYCDVMFVQTGTNRVFKFAALETSDPHTIVRCVFKHSSSNSVIEVVDSQVSGATVVVLRNNIAYMSGGGVGQRFVWASGASNNLQLLTADNNIAHGGGDSMFTVTLPATTTNLPLLRNNVGLAFTGSTYVKTNAHAWHASTANNYADGDSTNPGTGGGDISTPTDFVTSVTDLSCKDAATADSYLGTDLSAEHNIDFNLIEPSKWNVGATDFAVDTSGALIADGAFNDSVTEIDVVGSDDATIGDAYDLPSGERIRVIGISGNTLTVARRVLDTTAASITDADALTLVDSTCDAQTLEMDGGNSTITLGSGSFDGTEFAFGTADSRLQPDDQHGTGIVTHQIVFNDAETSARNFGINFRGSTSSPPNYDGDSAGAGYNGYHVQIAVDTDDATSFLRIHRLENGLKTALFTGNTLPAYTDGDRYWFEHWIADNGDFRIRVWHNETLYHDLTDAAASALEAADMGGYNNLCATNAGTLKIASSSWDSPCAASGGNAQMSRMLPLLGGRNIRKRRR